MLTVASLMTLFAVHLHEAVPEIEAGIFVDDRTILAGGPTCAETIEAAIEASQDFDKACGWIWDQGKGNVFQMNCTRKQDREATAKV